MFLVLFQLSTGDARNDEVGSIVISAESEAPRSPAQHLVDHEGSGRGGLRLWSRRVSLRNLEEKSGRRRIGGRRRRNFEECLRHRRAGPSHPVGSVCEHSNPRGRRRRRGRYRGRDPAERCRFSGWRDSEPGAVRGTHVGGPRNAGVQGGTESSNSLSSSAESIANLTSSIRAERFEPEAFLRAKQSNLSPVQIPPRIVAVLGASR